MLKSFILLILGEKKKDQRTIPPLCSPPIRFDDFIEQTGRTTFTSHVFTTGVRTGVTGD